MTGKEKDLYEGRSLFDEPITDTVTRRGLKHTSIKDSPTNQVVVKCLEHLQTGVESVVLICEKLIEEGVMPDERFVTGKPKFYPDICLLLDALCSEGKVMKLEGSHKDCRFRFANYEK